MSCKTCNKFGANCHPEHRMKFGVTCGRPKPFPGSSFSFGANCTEEHRMKFGVKGASVKGYGSISKDTLKTFLQMHGHDLELSATKDDLFKQIRRIYRTITPAEIKQSVNTSTSYESIKLVKDSIKAQEKEAKQLAILKRKNKILYQTFRDPTFEEVIHQRISPTGRPPPGSKVKRLTRPEVKQVDIDDLSDMFSAARASPDEMSDILAGLSVKFGKNKFGSG